MGLCKSIDDWAWLVSYITLARTVYARSWLLYYVVDATGCNHRTISMTKAPQPKTLEAQLTGPGGHRIQAK